MNRRTFMTRSASVLATTSTSGLPFTAQAHKDSKPLRLALISAASYGRPGEQRLPGSHHGTAFATVFNGWNEEMAKEVKGPFVRAGKRLSGGRVVKVWDPDEKAARAMAKACNIETITQTPEQCAEDVDAVLIVDDGSGAQWKYAEYPLRKGIPTFCDKPIAMRAKTAAEIGQLARETETPFMSASSLRFVPDIIQLRRELPRLGNIHLATAACGNDLIYYGIHALSMIYAVLGPGAISAMNVGRPDANIARIRFKDERDVVLMVGERAKMRAGYQINLYGTNGWKTVTPDLTDLYTYLLEAFLDLVHSGNESVPIEEEIEVIAALEASQRSLELGREVSLSEVLQGK
ncbi:MAG: Gfo/Idh/MocA family oxidoreductase [Verrucomicrobia bacterium]|nr:Gfo/Idh/MocA family oxidoreductase [Verrucomicrobiota bacterium]MBT5479009.1 Gfo/Idh/MocA family oxidoreductase [Verrucomicrobiota bacterium]